MKKILFFIFVLLSAFFTLKVNAYTYIGDKKATFYEIEGTIDSALYNYNNKYYNYDYKNNQIIEMNFENDILTKSDASQDYNTFMNEIYKGQEYTNYDYGEDGKFYVYHFEGLNYTKEEFPVDVTNLQYFGTIDEKLYFADNTTTQSIKIYNPDGTLSSEIKIEDLLTKIDLSEYEKYNITSEIFGTIVNGEVLINLYIKIEENGNQIKAIDYIFDSKYNQIFYLEENSNNQKIIFPTFIKTNNGYRMLYSDCRDLTNGIEGCAVKVLDEKNNAINLIASTGQSIISTEHGLVIINALDKDNNKHTTYIYDNNLNLIKSYNGAHRAYPSIVIKDFETTFISYLESKVLERNDFLIRIEYSDNDNITETKYELMKIENSSKVNITGTVIDEFRKDLKDYMVELHSTPRTYTLENDGYFKFDNVVEGPHTLIVKKADGTKIAEKQINIILSNETKLDEDTLYFNQSDNGININITLSNDELKISSIDKGIKDKPSKIDNIIENIIPNVPETSDSLYLYISLLGILSIFSVIVIKNIKKIKK